MRTDELWQYRLWNGDDHMPASLGRRLLLRGVLKAQQAAADADATAQPPLRRLSVDNAGRLGSRCHHKYLIGDPVSCVVLEDFILQPDVQEEHQYRRKFPTATPRAAHASVRLSQLAGTASPFPLKARGCFFIMYRSAYEDTCPRVEIVSSVQQRRHP
jgi:hypothetical protein